MISLGRRPSPAAQPRTWRGRTDAGFRRHGRARGAARRTGIPGPMASLRCATSAPAAAPSRSSTPAPDLRRSARSCDTPISPATRSISSSSITCWPPMSALAVLGGTARMGSQTRLLDACRRAKEQLSTAAVSTVAGASGEVAHLTRTEFEQLISPPLDRFLASLQDTLRRKPRIPAANVRAGVAIVGGGASIPLITARLSQGFGVPVRSTAQPALLAALGAAASGRGCPSRPAARDKNRPPGSRHCRSCSSRHGFALTPESESRSGR